LVSFSFLLYTLLKLIERIILIMASGFSGKKKHRLNRKKYLLKRRRRKHENA